MGLIFVKVYSMEIAMVTNEIILSDEVADYPNHMLLSDFGGIFGFFVGITMLTFVSCLKKIYWYTIRVSQRITLPKIFFNSWTPTDCAK